MICQRLLQLVLLVWVPSWQSRDGRPLKLEPLDVLHWPTAPWTRGFWVDDDINPQVPQKGDAIPLVCEEEPPNNIGLSWNAKVHEMVRVTTHSLESIQPLQKRPTCTLVANCRSPVRCSRSCFLTKQWWMHCCKQYTSSNSLALGRQSWNEAASTLMPNKVRQVTGPSSLDGSIGVLRWSNWDSSVHFWRSADATEWATKTKLSR